MKSYAFKLLIRNPAETMEKLSLFFLERKIQIDALQMHRYRHGEASVIIHCQIEKDRIARTVQLLQELPGIMELERMEGK